MKLSLKITVLMLLIAFMLASICPAISASSADTLAITSEEVMAERGDTVDVTLVVTQNPGIVALHLDVAQVEGFELLDVTVGNILTIMTANKRILLENSSPSNNNTETGILLTLKFKISENACVGRNYINVSSISCCDSTTPKPKDVKTSIAPIVINVKEGSSEEESSSEDTSAPTVETEPATESTDEPATESTGESASESDTEPAVPSDNRVGWLGGCFGEIGIGGMIITTLVAGAWFFRKKH